MYWFKKICRAILNLLPVFAFLLPLFGSCSVSALKYGITQIDFGQDTLYPRRFTDMYDNEQFGYFEKSRDFLIVTDNNHSFPDNVEFPHTWIFSGNYDDVHNTCELSLYNDGVDAINYSDHFGLTNTTLTSPSLSSDFFYNSFDSPFAPLNTPLSSGINQWFIDRSGALCSIMDYRYTDTRDESALADQYMPKWNFRSLVNIPLVNNKFSYQASIPYYYNFNDLYLRGTDKSDGVVYVKDGLKMSDIMGTNINNFSTVLMSLSPFYQAGNTIDYDFADDPEFSSPEPSGIVNEFDLTGSIVFDGDYSITPPSQSSFGVTMTVSNYDPVDLDPDSASYDELSDGTHFFNLPSNSQNINCDVTEYHISNNDEENRLDFSCHYNPSNYNLNPIVRFRFLDIGLIFGSMPGSGSSFLSTSSDYTFKNFAIVTNNDDTPISWDATSSNGGGDLSNAPGYGLGGGGYDGTDTEPDFFTSLKELFSFVFINPFTPLFNMFSSGSSCAQIPTIAGLIHSQETQVCPWFDSNVRAISTPVFGLASMMLIFGFAVRWLGSSSGNMFEDSSGESLSNLGGSWRRYKK